MKQRQRERGWVIRGLAIQSAGLSIALALAFFLSGPDRVSALAYRILVAQTGGPDTWGVVFLFCGLLTVGASLRGLRALRLALCTSALAYLVLAGAFTLAALHYPTANLTAPVVYGWLAYAHVFFVLLITYKLNHDPAED